MPEIASPNSNTNRDGTQPQTFSPCIRRTRTCKCYQIIPVLLTYNEEQNISRTLSHLAWAKDIVVVDSGSTDGIWAALAHFPNAKESQIVSPRVLPFTLQTKFSTLIRDVATTGNSGSGVFDPNRKCLLGIISGKLTSHTTEGDKDIAKYFVPAAAIRDFMPVEFGP